MGMGEPLLNLDRVLESIAALNDPRAVRPRGAAHHRVHVGRGARDPAPDRARAAVHARGLAPRGAQRRCATSSCRSTAAGRWRRWSTRPASTRAATGRRVTYEVTMIDGINDTDIDADALADLLRGDHAHVNLIPMNPVAHTPWTGTPMPVHRAVRRPAARGRHRDDDPASTAARRSVRRAASSPPSTPAQPAPDRRPAPPRAARRRERGRPARRAKPRAGPGRGGGGLTVADRRPARVQIAASILDADLGRARRRDPPRRGRRRGPHPPRRHGRPLRPQHHVRLEDDRGRPARHGPARSTPT